jgi:hypothetical protein
MIFYRKNINYESAAGTVLFKWNTEMMRKQYLFGGYIHYLLGIPYYGECVSVYKHTLSLKSCDGVATFIFIYFVSFRQIFVGMEYKLCVEIFILFRHFRRTV